MKALLVTLVSVILLSACSKAPTVDPERGLAENAMPNPQDVRSILVTQDRKDQEACLRELEACGASVLYQGATGVILTNRTKDELSLTSCRALVSPNITWSLGTPTQPGTGGKGRPETADLAKLLELIPAETIGARSFVRAHPTFDGRGAIVGILDTGVELDHPMLKTTPEGKDKVLGAYDFSGEGLVSLNTVEVGADGKFQAPSGTYSVKGIAGASFKFGLFKGSTLANAQELSANDSFKDLGVVSYLLSDGSARARIDVDDDKDFSDEAELFDFGKSRKFVKLGNKQSLTTAVSLSNNGSSLAVVFDDGSHGTHVAGIATGYDPKGLQGVAPGAQIISLKIGDNRLSGGSTTTASMMMAIDQAARLGVHIINMSYGIRAGSNFGTSAIDRYVDKVAKEKGVLFAISAGNEGPGLLTVGTPAGAELAIVNAAYLPKETAKNNYGYANVEEDNLWYFSSVGPLLNGGWKPTLLAPGTALSSVPNWLEGLANYSGTSMASPQVTGGLALVVSGGLQDKLPVDRVSVTRAVYASAKHIANLARIEQGHGLMDVPSAFEALKSLKETLPVEYQISISSSTSPAAQAKGIYVRSHKLPENLFTIKVTPQFPAGTPEEIKKSLKTYKLTPSAEWIRTPSQFYLLGSARSFQADVDAAVMGQPGLHSEVISAIDESTGRVAFEFPVTIVVPEKLPAAGHLFSAEAMLKVGQTSRHFVYLPSGVTSVQVDLLSDGPMIWGQLLDPEGRKVLDLGDTDRRSPQEPLLNAANISRAGVYELDVVAPPYNKRTAKITVRVKGFSLKVSQGPGKTKAAYDVRIENDFDALKMSADFQLAYAERRQTVEVKGTQVEIPFAISESDQKQFSAIEFGVKTSKAIYDLMTDYPYLVITPEGKTLVAGGLEMDSVISLGNLTELMAGNYKLVIMGAFTSEAPANWIFDLSEKRVLESPVSILSGLPSLIESGLWLEIPLDLSRYVSPVVKAFQNCAQMKIKSPSGRLIQTMPICYEPGETRGTADELVAEESSL